MRRRWKPEGWTGAWAWLVLLALLGACAQPPAPGGAARPTPPVPVAAADARAIDAEAAAIRAGQHLPMPGLEAVGPGSREVQVAEIRSRNDTPHGLMLLYSGPTSQRLMLDPGGQGTVRLQPGEYLVTARATDPKVSVLPFAGQRRIEPGTYQSQWVVKTSTTPTPAPVRKGKGLPLTDTARQVRDWMARVAKSAPLRDTYAEGGLGIEEFMSNLAVGSRAQLLVGQGSTQSGRCSLLLVHADQLFPFDVSGAEAGGPHCRGEQMVSHYGGAGGQVTRRERLGAIQDFRIPGAASLATSRPFTASLRLRLDQLPTDKLAVRLTTMMGRSTTVQRTPPLTLKRGDNTLTLNFGAMLAPTAAGASLAAPEGAEGPAIVVADLTYADSGRANQLLANSAAVLVQLRR